MLSLSKYIKRYLASTHIQAGSLCSLKNGTIKVYSGTPHGSPIIHGTGMLPAGMWDNVLLASAVLLKPSTEIKMKNFPNTFLHKLIDGEVVWSDDYKIMALNNDFMFDRKAHSRLDQIISFKHPYVYLQSHNSVKGPSMLGSESYDNFVWEFSSRWECSSSEIPVVVKTKQRMLRPIENMKVAVYNATSKDKYLCFYGDVKLGNMHEYGSGPITVNIFFSFSI
jgi:hypothetical protein